MDSYIPIKYFWRTFIALIIVAAIAAGVIGYYVGIARLEVAQQFGHDAAITEYPSISYDRSKQAYCADEDGNYYYVTRKGILFKIKRGVK